MAENDYKDQWVYVFVCDPGPQESFLGLFDEEKNENVIPAFKTRDEANDCFLSLPREKGKKYELQAVHVDDIYSVADRNGFEVALVDGDGRIIKG